MSVGLEGFPWISFSAFKPKSVASESPQHLRTRSTRRLVASGRHRPRCADEKPQCGPGPLFGSVRVLPLGGLELLGPRRCSVLGFKDSVLVVTNCWAEKGRVRMCNPRICRFALPFALGAFLKVVRLRLYSHESLFSGRRGCFATAFLRTACSCLNSRQRLSWKRMNFQSSQD